MSDLLDSLSFNTYSTVASTSYPEEDKGEQKTKNKTMVEDGSKTQVATNHHPFQAFHVSRAKPTEQQHAHSALVVHNDRTVRKYSEDASLPCERAGQRPYPRPLLLLRRASCIHAGPGRLRPFSLFSSTTEQASRRINLIGHSSQAGPHSLYPIWAVWWGACACEAGELTLLFVRIEFAPLPAGARCFCLLFPPAVPSHILLPSSSLSSSSSSSFLLLVHLCALRC